MSADEIKGRWWWSNFLGFPSRIRRKVSDPADSLREVANAFPEDDYAEARVIEAERREIERGR